jgi:hypothetical protein
MKLIVNTEQYNRLLNEGTTYSADLDAWVNIIVDSVMGSIFDIDGGDVISLKSLSKKYKDRDFFKRLPIESIIIDIEINEVEGDYANATAGYVPKYSHLSDDVVEGMNVIEDVEFVLEVDLPEIKDRKKSYQLLYDHFKDIFVHEILHVYEWYHRGLSEPAEQKECTYLYQFGDLRGDILEKIAYLLYVQLSFEINAFVHQAYHLVKKQNPKDYDEFMDALKGLFIYKFVDEMLKFDSEEAFKQIKRLPIERQYLLHEIKDCFYSSKDEKGELFLKKETDIETFLKDIEKRFKIRGTALQRKLHKLISDII